MKKIAFFDIDGTFRNNPLPKILYKTLLASIKEEELAKHHDLLVKCETLRRAYGADVGSGDLNDDIVLDVAKKLDIDPSRLSSEERELLFGEYTRTCLEFSMLVLAEKDKTEVKSIAKDVVMDNKYQDYIFSVKLLEVLKAKGYKTFVISGSPQFLIGEIVKAYGFDSGIGQKYQPNNQGVYEAVEPFTWTDKDKIMDKVIEDVAGCRENAFVVCAGDTLGDLSMLLEADLSFLINPSGSLLKSVYEVLDNETEKYSHTSYLDMEYSKHESKFVRIYERKQTATAGRLMVKDFFDSQRKLVYPYSDDLFCEGDMLDYLSNIL